MKKCAISTVLLIIFLSAVQAEAVTISEPTLSVWGALDPTAFSAIGGNDYGNALGYNNAGNQRGHWQGIGTTNYLDDGVKWSVGGSDFGTNADLVIGKEVTFKFLFWQLNNGHHPYDQIFAAFDFSQDGVFDNPGDTILYERLWTNNPQVIDDITRTNSVYQELTLSFIVPDTFDVGSTWLRTRATCWETPYPKVDAYKWLTQGETEDYKLNVVAAPVPVPAAMILLGSGLAGLVGLKRKTNSLF